MNDVQKLISKDEEERIRNKVRWRESYYDFCRDCLGFQEMNDTHRELCEFIQRNKKKSKICLLPRYSFKSCVITQGHSLWRLTQDPNLRILIYSDSASKAQGFLTGIKNHITGNTGRSLFRDYYGKWETDPHKGKWNESQIVISSRTNHQVEPTIDTGGVESTKVGMHFDIIIFDDIVSDVNTTTKDQMDKVYGCFQNSLALLKPGGEIILVGTIWHFGDTYRRLMSANEETNEYGIFIRDAEQKDKSGRLLFEDIGLDEEFLSTQKKKIGSYKFSCNPYEAGILMSDWSSKPIGEIKPGDKVVGWKIGTGKEKRRTVESTVLKVQSRVAETVSITLESGRVIRCTPDHQWFTGRSGRDGYHRKYSPAKEGHHLQFVTEGSPEIPDSHIRDAAWLGGIFDGEGHCNKGSIHLAQDRKYNPIVHKRIGDVLENLGFGYGTSPKGSYWINGGRDEKIRFLHWCKPAKSDKILKNLYKKGGWLVKGKDKIISIQKDSTELVYALQTTTGNYIAWGYASKNCIYKNSPVDDETATFRVNDFKFYGTLKESDYRTETGKYSDLYITATIDPAGEGEDYTGITVVGTDRNLRMHVLEATNKHLQPNEQVEEIFRLNRIYHFRRLGVETTFFRGRLMKDIQLRLQQDQKNQWFHTFGIEEFKTRWRKGEGKHQRIESLQPFHERGDLLFPGKSFEELKGVFSELAYQMIQYPKAPHDDLLDSLAWHVQIIRPGGIPKKAGPPKYSPAWLEQEWLKDYNRNIRRYPKKYRRIITPSLS